MIGKQHQDGFGYIAILVIIFAIALFANSAFENIFTNTKREKELDLIFIGNQYAKAIESYYKFMPAGVNEFPSNLQDLAIDSRTLPPTKHLRKNYKDPMTDLEDWALIVNEDNKIIGVHSKSDQPPLFHNFYKSKYISPDIFNKAISYSEWTFIFSNKLQDQQP